MGAKRDVLYAQRKWAERQEIPLDEKGRMRDAESNLLSQDLSPHARKGYEGGGGQEMAGHMKSPHSSSALVVNFFDYWTDRENKSPLVQALGIDANCSGPLDFERKFPTRVSEEVGSEPPNLDVAMDLDSAPDTALESKFTEWMTRSTYGKTKFKPAYFDRGELWNEQCLPECQKLADALYDAQQRRQVSPYQRLDVVQLLKHALGLATRLGPKGFRLYYLYYDCPGWESEQHQREIECFRACIGEELHFKALTYQKVYKRLRASEQAEPEYLDYLRNRYFCGKGAPRD